MWKQLNKRGVPLTNGRSSSQKRLARIQYHNEMTRRQYIAYQQELKDKERKRVEEERKRHADMCKKLNLPTSATSDECRDLENKLEQINLEKKRLQNEIIMRKKMEEKRLEEERLEKDRLEKERLEEERLEKERLEKDRLEKERLEEERLEKERLEKERLEFEILKQKEIIQLKLELENIKAEAEKLEKERLERLEREKVERAKKEKVRLEKERLEKIRLEKIRLEKERLEKIRLEKERLEKERLEKIRLEEVMVEREQKNRKFNILIRNTYRPNMFKECIESVQEQTHIIPILGNNVRIICCYDDKRSSKYLKKYKNMFKNINLLEIVPNKSNTLQEYNLYCNNLMDKVKDGWILFLNDDNKFLNKHTLSNISKNIDNEDDIIFWSIPLGDAKKNNVYAKMLKNIDLNTGKQMTCDAWKTGFCVHSKHIRKARATAGHDGLDNFLANLLKKNKFNKKFLDQIVVHPVYNKRLFGLREEDYDLHALIRERGIKQCYMSEKIAHLKPIIQTNYKIMDYDNRDSPCIFFGLYNDNDISIIRNHIHGEKYIVPMGIRYLYDDTKSENGWGENHNSDFDNYKKTLTVNPLFLSISDKMTDLFKYNKEYSTRIHFDCVDKMLFKPTSGLGTKIFIFNGETPNLRNASIYGKKYIDQVIKRFPNTEIIWSSMTNIPYHKLPEIYNQVAIGLCLTEQKHEVAGLKEMNLMNIPIIHNHSIFGLKWKNVDDIIMHLMKTKNISRQIKASYFNGINIETSINNTNKKFDTLTIIINSYNPHPPDLYKSLASCFSQKKINIKIIISTVENDPTIKIVNNLKNNKFNTLRDTMTRDIKLVICKLSEHPGRGPRGIFFQLNKALEEVKTRYVSYFSSNDVMLPTKSYNEIESLKNNNSIFCFSRYNSYYPLTKKTERFNYPKNLMNYSNLLKSNFINDCATIDLNQLTEPIQFNYEKYGNVCYWHLWLKLLNKHGKNCMSINNNVEWIYIREENKSQAIERSKNKNKTELYKNLREFMLSEFNKNIKPKSLYEYNDINEKFWWWNDIKNTKPVEMTVALPALNAKKIIWLSLESLKKQININFAWELIVFEEEGISKSIVQSYAGILPGCVRIIYKTITKDDAFYKLEDIKENNCTSYYTLLEKWINIAKIADNNSKIFVKHAVDCYSSPKRLYIHYEHFKNEMCYYSTQPKGYFYNIKKNKWLLYDGYKLEPIKWNEYGERKLKYLNDNFKDNKNIKVRGCHLNMATRTELVKKLSFSKNPLRSGIDSYLLSEICKIIKKRPEEEKIIFTDDEIDKDNWKYSLDTDGFNNISHFRKDLYTKNTYDFFKIIEKKNNECCIDSYIISYLRIIYLKNTNEILNINKKILINIKSLDSKLKSIIDNLKLDYDIFKSYENQNLNDYFLIIDHDYNKNLYEKSLENKIYYSCKNSKNNHILKVIDYDILKKLMFRIKCIDESYIFNINSILKNKRVLVCSIWDYGFSAYNIYLSLKKINPNVDYFNFNVKYRNMKMKRNGSNIIYNSEDYKNVFFIKEYDVLLFKSDFNIDNVDTPNPDNLCKYELLQKFVNNDNTLTINIVGGSFYRKDSNLDSYNITCKKIGLNTIPLYNKIKSFDFVFSLTHDLSYYFDSILFGHKTINHKYKYKLNKNDTIIICHSPSNETKKGSFLLYEVINSLIKKYNFKFVVLKNISQLECIKKKRLSHLFIDQLFVGGYGNSLIEAISYGIPCLNYINYDINYPIINSKPLYNDLYSKIKYFLDLSYEDKLILSKESYKYFLKYHTFSDNKYEINLFYKMNFKDKILSIIN